MSIRIPKHIFSSSSISFTAASCVASAARIPRWNRKFSAYRSTNFARCLGNIDVERIHTLRLFNYGEPLLHRQLAAIVAQIPQQRWKASVVEISTNAQWVDWDEFEAMVRLEVVNKLVVSCDGDGTPESYERLRPPSTWEKFVEFLDRATRLRDKWAPAMQLGTRTVIQTREDAARWEDFLRPRGWTPEFRRWMALPEAKENLTGRVVMTPPRPAACFSPIRNSSSDHPWFGESQSALRGRGWNGGSMLHAPAGRRIREISIPKSTARS